MTKKTTTKKPARTKAAANDEAAATKPARKKKQLDIPGTERKRITELDDAAEAYRVARNKRQDHSKTEKAKKQELMACARKHGVELYVYESEDGEDLKVEYTAETKENVKVTKIDAGEDDE